MNVIDRIGGIGVVRRIARPFAFLILLLALVAWSELSAAVATEIMSAQEAELARLLNAERSSRGMNELAHSDALRTVARRHSQRMMIEGTIFHNQRLQEDVEAVFPAWARIGENVGMGPSVPSVHQAFMDSPAHRANVLDPDFYWQGVGVVSGGSRLFMTENFLKLQAGAARPLPAQFRLSGPDRASTAQSIADFGFTPGAARGAVLAPSTDFHGALAGAALAGALDGPTLLSNPSGLDAAAEAGLKRALGNDRSGKTVYLVGGPFASSVRDAVAGLGVRVVAIGSGDHAAMAAEVARNLPQRPSTAFLATVTDYPDALAAAAVSAVTGWPVLYTDPNGLPTSTRQVLRDLGISKTYVVGGTVAVSQQVASELDSIGAPVVQRIAGADRFATSAAVANFALGQGLNAQHPSVATARNYPDALAGGALAGSLGSPVLLTESGFLPGPTSDWLHAQRNSVHAVYILGGPVAVSTAVGSAISSVLR